MTVAPLSASERASDLLARMTTAEKAAQVVGVLPQPLGAPGEITQERLDAHLSQGIGHICNVGTAAGDAVGIAKFNNTIQRYLRDSTRLGIPAILHNEALNGVTGEGFTSFPTPIGLAASWDPASVEQMADLIRRQLKAVGIRQALAPVLDVARDARWGRVHETYGEDVLLASTFGVAYVRGLQGEGLFDGVVATAKHFIGYSLTEGGQNMAATHLGPRELRDVHAAPFEAAIRLAGLGSVMNSYSEIDGEPVATSRAILTDLLREKLAFEGTVVSDYRSLFYVVNRQGIGTARGVARAALRAGLDVELPASFAYGAELIAGVEAGDIPIADLDLAVHRTLTHKFALGLFEDPFVDTEPIRLQALAKSGREISLRLAEESVTLLKNRDGVLPLPASLRSVAVIGPHADSVMAGFANYTHPPFLETLRGIATGQSRMAGMEQMMNVPDPAARAKMQEKIEAMAAIDPEAIARRDYGALSLSAALQASLPDAKVMTVAGTGVLDEEPADISSAVALAQKAEVVVLALGGRSAAFSGRATEGEGSDSATIQLPSNQRQLVEAIAALGKPVVAVVYMGKPYALSEIEPHVAAIVTGYIPGPEGGRALAGALTGAVNPSGKLPFTVPRHVGQAPIHHAQKVGSGQRRNSADQFTGYVDLENSPLYPFGYGLSYTSFRFDDLEVDVPEAVDGEAVLRFTVTNTGGFAGAEVAQVYVSPPAYSISRPARQLAAFARVELAPGDRAKVEITIDMRQLGYTDEHHEFVVDPGSYGIAVGTSSEDSSLSSEFTTTGERRLVAAPHSHLPAAKVTSLATAQQ